jgi:hypothetical protein
MHKEFRELEMKNRQNGMIERRAILLLVLFGALAVFAYPQVSDFSERSTVNEAYHFANQSKLRLSEFYVLSARFPSTEGEVRSVTTANLGHPDFLKGVEVDNDDQDYDVVVKFYLNEEAVKSPSDSESFIFLAANKSTGGVAGLKWSCGARGVDEDLLPAECLS